MRRNLGKVTAVAWATGHDWMAWLLRGLAASLLLVFPLSVRGSEPGQGVKKSAGRFLSGGRVVGVCRYEPTAGGRYPGLVLLHGVDGLETNGRVYGSLAERLAARGYAVFVVHYFDRTGTRGQPLTELGNQLEGYLSGKATEEQTGVCRGHFEDWMTAVVDAVAYVRAQPTVDGKRIGLVGFSLGAYLALSVAAREELQIAVAVDLCGGLPRPLYANFRSLPPLLILHGDKDQMVPVEEAQALRALLVSKGLPCEMKLYEGMGHLFTDGRGGFRWDAALDAESRTHVFLEKHLGRGASKNTAP